MFMHTGGNMNETPVSKEELKSQLMCLLLANDNVSDEYKRAIDDVCEIVNELPIVETAGKKLVKKYYPRICIKDNMGLGKRLSRVGDNIHDTLLVRHHFNGSSISYMNLQCCCGTECDEEYEFVGEICEDDIVNDEYVPFDEVWVEVEE